MQYKVRIFGDFIKRSKFIDFLNSRRKAYGIGIPCIDVNILTYERDVILLEDVEIKHYKNLSAIKFNVNMDILPFFKFLATHFPGLSFKLTCDKIDWYIKNGKEIKYADRTSSLRSGISPWR